MKSVLVLIFSLFTIASFAQKKIGLDQVRNHINDSVEVKGKVAAITYLKNADTKPTVISVGANSSNPNLSIIIPGEVRKKLGYNPEEEKYRQGMVIATGKLKLVKGKPCIIIVDPDQLVFIYDEEVPSSEVPPIQQ
jgi:hypothetical protein